MKTDGGLVFDGWHELQHRLRRLMQGEVACKCFFYRDAGEPIRLGAVGVRVPRGSKRNIVEAEYEHSRQASRRQMRLDARGVLRLCACESCPALHLTTRQTPAQNSSHCETPS